MKAEVISIGDELLIGQVVNTNASFICEKLTDLNIPVKKVSTVGDHRDYIINAFNVAIRNSDVIVVTGGLGPTHDDITRNCVAEFFNSKLIMNETVLSDIKERFARFNRPLSKVNEEQALVPDVADVVRNLNGTAPGYWIEKDNKVFIVMPGVPREMKEMMTGEVSDKLKELAAKQNLFYKRANILTTGIAESTLFEKLGDITELVDSGTLAFLPNYSGVRLRIGYSGEDELLVQSKISEIEQRIRSKVGRYIYGREDDTLGKVVGRLLSERGLTISVAESCTGGNISNEITNYSGSSIYFERGIVAYSNASKVEILNVNEDTLQNFGAVSKETVEEMAQGIRGISGSDYGLAITGIMGPTGATNEKPVGTVFIACSDAKTVVSKKYNFGDDRIINKQRATFAALELVRRILLGINVES